MITTDSIDKLAGALVKAQAEMPGTRDDGKGYNYTYTTLDQIINRTRPSLTANGLAIVQAPISEDGMIGLTTRLIHTSGQWMESTIYAPPNADKQSVAIQAAGSIITYLRRYAYTSFTGIAAEDDTDGVPDKPPQNSTGPDWTESEPAPVDSRGESSPQAQAARAQALKVPMPTKAMQKKFHATGKDKYGDAWDDKRPELVKAITAKREDGAAVTSSNDLNRAEMKFLIDGMVA